MSRGTVCAVREELLRERMIAAGVLRPSETSLPRPKLPPGTKVLRMTPEDHAAVRISYEYGEYFPGGW